MNIREIALKLLLDYEENGKYANLSLNSHIADSLTHSERSALTALFYTAVERKLTYDYIIAALTNRSVDKLSSHTKNILRLGLCQLLDMDSVPDFAAVSETVKLAKNKGERALVNATLRTAAREREGLPMPRRERNLARYLSVRYSVPLPTVKYFLSELGEEGCEAFLKTTLTTPPTAVTVNTLKTTPDALLKRLVAEGYAATRAAFSPISLRIEGSFDPRRCAAFADGELIVQDEASAIAPLVLAPRSGELVVDVCAAPGGKSMTLAVLSEDKADIRAFDLHESKLSLIEGSAERLGIKSVSVARRDATTPDEALVGKVDKVLCDVPCSGLGVLAKKPDLRYKDLTTTDSLPALQGEILEQSARYLRCGGTLVYSTCTLRREENGEVVARFLGEHPEFAPEDFEVGELKSHGGMLTLYPHLHNTDGFFVARLRRVK